MAGPMGVPAPGPFKGITGQEQFAAEGSDILEFFRRLVAGRQGNMGVPSPGPFRGIHGQEQMWKEGQDILDFFRNLMPQGPQGPHQPYVVPDIDQSNIGGLGGSPDPKNPGAVLQPPFYNPLESIQAPRKKDDQQIAGAPYDPLSSIRAPGSIPKEKPYDPLSSIRTRATPTTAPSVPQTAPEGAGGAAPIGGDAAPSQGNAGLDAIKQALAGLQMPQMPEPPSVATPPPPRAAAAPTDIISMLLAMGGGRQLPGIRM